MGNHPLQISLFVSFFFIYRYFVTDSVLGAQLSNLVLNLRNHIHVFSWWYAKHLECFCNLTKLKGTKQKHFYFDGTKDVLYLAYYTQILNCNYLIYISVSLLWWIMAETIDTYALTTELVSTRNRSCNIWAKSRSFIPSLTAVWQASALTPAWSSYLSAHNIQFLMGSVISPITPIAVKWGRSILYCQIIHHKSRKMFQILQVIQNMVFIIIVTSSVDFLLNWPQSHQEDYQKAKLYCLCDFYRPHPKDGKVLFSQVSVCPHWGGGATPVPGSFPGPFWGGTLVPARGEG